MKTFFRFFARHHTFANLFVIMILLMGGYTLMNINRDLYPSVDFGMMSITTIYTGRCGRGPVYSGMELNHIHADHGNRHQW